MGRTFFWVNKNCVGNFLGKTKFGSEISVGQKKFGSEISLGPKKLVRNLFGSKTNFRPNFLKLKYSCSYRGVNLEKLQRVCVTRILKGDNCCYK